jgi:hypothetical protein
MELLNSPNELKSKILDELKKNGLVDPCYQKMLDYTIEIFEKNGLGSEYYGYHNINHELEVALGILLIANNRENISKLTDDDLKYLYVAALFHDLDPQKYVDKPHEKNVLEHIVIDSTIKDLISQSNLDLEIIKALILRTTYPWAGDVKKECEKEIQEYFKKSKITNDNLEKQEHFMWVGWILSIIDRVIGYALGDFSKAMHLAKTNSHALAWHPSFTVRRSVTYFEDLIGKESEMCEMVLRCLPKHMRKNFMDNVQGFLNLRQQEIQTQSDFLYDDIKFTTKIESTKLKNNEEFISALHSIYLELPRPLRLERNFEQSLNESTTILNTLRLRDKNGPIIGFAKGGPLEHYQLRSEIKDENFGKNNTIFLEPIALKMGYWGLGGGHKMRQLFVMQAHAMNYEYMTSFALRDVIQRRCNGLERAEFVTKFDPERWDYYRIKL